MISPSSSAFLLEGTLFDACWSRSSRPLSSRNSKVVRGHCHDGHLCPCAHWWVGGTFVGLVEFFLHSADFSSPFHGGCGKTRGEMGPDGMLRWKPQADSVFITETIHPSQPQVGHEHSHGGHGGHGHGHELWGKPTVVILRFFLVLWNGCQLFLFDVSLVLSWYHCVLVISWFWFLVCFNWYRPCFLNCFVLNDAQFIVLTAVW